MQMRQDKNKQRLLTFGRTTLKPANDNKKKPRFEITWFKDIAERQIKEHVIDGVFGVGEFSVVVGPPGSGKSVIIALPRYRWSRAGLLAMKDLPPLLTLQSHRSR